MKESKSYRFESNGSYWLKNDRNVVLSELSLMLTSQYDQKRIIIVIYMKFVSLSAYLV